MKNPIPRAVLALLIVACLGMTISPARSQASLWQTCANAGQKAYEKGNYREAEKFFRESLSATDGLKDNGFRRSRSLLGLAESLRCLAKFDECEPLFKEALSLTEKSQGQNSPQVALCFLDLGSLYLNKANYPLAENAYKHCIEMVEKKYGRFSPYLTAPLHNLARAYEDEGRYKEAEDLYMRALAICKMSKKADKEHLVYILFNLGLLYMHQGQYAKAEQYIKSAFAAGENIIPKDSSKYAGGLQGLASLYMLQGRFQEAEPLMKRAIEIKTKVLGAAHPEVAVSYAELANLLQEQGRYQEAEPAVAKAQEIIEKSVGKKHPEYAMTLSLQAMGAMNQAHYQEAEGYIKQALELRETLYGPDHPLVASSFRDLGLLYLEEGRVAEAEEVLRKSVGIYERAYGSEHPDLAKALRGLANAVRKKDAAEAEELLKRSLTICQNLLGSEHPDVGTSLFELADFYKKEGKYEDCLTLLEGALQSHEHAFGPHSAKVAGDLDALASIYTALNRGEEAASVKARALDIKRTLPGASKISLSGESGRGENQGNKVASSRQFKPVADKWALVIGISNFKDPSINLKFATKDASDFRNFLIQKANFKADHVKFLSDADATRDNIIGALGDRWLGRLANRDDLVVIYVSSHGSTSKEEVGGVNFLVAHDTNKNSLLGTGIPMQWLTKIIKEQVHSDRVVLILDVCHSASAAGDKGLTRSAAFDIDKVTLGTGQAVLCSSLADQVSWESKSYPNSVFTRNLIQALSQQNASCPLSSAYEQLKESVESEVLRERGEMQTPVLNITSWLGTDPILGVLPAKPRPGLPVR